MDTRRYLKHFFILTSGTALGQLITFLAYPLLTRSYTPHDFGIFTVFLAAVSTAGAVACGRFDMAVQVSHDEDKWVVHALSQLINTGFSVLGGIGSLLYSVEGGGTLGPGLAALVAVAIYLTGYTNASSMLLMKQELYRLNSIGALLRTLLTAIPQLLLFYVWPSALGLSLGLCLGLSVQALFLAVVLHSKQRPRISAPELRGAFQRYRRYLLDVPNTLLAAFSMNALSFILLALFSPEQVGFYSVAYRLMVVPLSLFSSSLSQVYFQKAARSYRTGGVFWKEFRFNLLASTGLSCAIFLSLAALTRPLVTFYLGQSWTQSGEIMLYLSPLLALQFVSVSISSTPLVTGKLHWLLLFNLALVASLLLSSLLARMHAMSLTQFLTVNVGLSSVVHLVFIITVAVHTRLHFVTRPLEQARN